VGGQPAYRVSFLAAEKPRKPVLNRKLRSRKNRTSIALTQNSSKKLKKYNIDTLQLLERQFNIKAQKR
jgi:hypothetical protein